MLRDDQRGLNRHLAGLRAWRSLSVEDQSRAIWSGNSSFVPAGGPDDGRLRVGLWCPCLGLGGAEVWQLSLARTVDTDRISWQGAAVTEGRGAAHPGMIRELERMMPIGYGLDAARALASSCDVIVSWSVTSISALLEGLESAPSVIVACHFPAESPWGSGTERLFEGVHRFVGVSELAVEAAPLSARNRFEVIWNAIDAHRLQVAQDRAAIHSSWMIPTEDPVVGYLGRLALERARVEKARTFARGRLSLARFGRDWTELIVRSSRRPSGSFSRVAS